MHALIRLFFLTVKKDFDSELQDEVPHFALSLSCDISDISFHKLISFWAIRFPPRLRPRLAETASILMNVCRRAISDVIFSLII